MPNTYIDLIPSFQSLLQKFFTNFKSSLLEWLVTLATLLLVLIPHKLITPNMTLPHLSLKDSFFPYVSQTFPSYLVVIIFIVIPFILLIIFYFLLSIRSFSSFYYERNVHFDLNFAILSLLQTLTITLLFTEFLKVYVSRPRPNFFSYCGYNETLNKCTGSAHDVRDSHLSFPSGHSSISFCSSVWILLFLQHMKTSNSYGQIWYIYLQLIFIVLATFCASSRIVNHMHHTSDVITGIVMGISFACLVFKVQVYRIFDKFAKVKPISSSNSSNDTQTQFDNREKFDKNDFFENTNINIIQATP